MMMSYQLVLPRGFPNLSPVHPIRRAFQNRSNKKLRILCYNWLHVFKTKDRVSFNSFCWRSLHMAISLLLSLNLLQINNQ